MCVCVGVGVYLGFTNGFFLRVSVYQGEFCGFKFTVSSFSFFFFFICIHMSVYVSVYFEFFLSSENMFGIRSS